MESLFREYDGPMWSMLRAKAYAIDNLRKGVAFRRQLVDALHRRNSPDARGAVRRHLDRLYTLYFDVGSDVRPHGGRAIARAVQLRRALSQ
jgi:DNA-binding FadR family transcriptional regulator